MSARRGTLCPSILLPSRLRAAPLWLPLHHITRPPDSHPVVEVVGVPAWWGWSVSFRFTVALRPQKPSGLVGTTTQLLTSDSGSVTRRRVASPPSIPPLKKRDGVWRWRSYNCRHHLISSQGWQQFLSCVLHFHTTHVLHLVCSLGFALGERRQGDGAESSLAENLCSYKSC